MGSVGLPYSPIWVGIAPFGCMQQICHMCLWGLVLIPYMSIDSPTSNAWRLTSLRIRIHEVVGLKFLHSIIEEFYVNISFNI